MWIKPTTTITTITITVRDRARCTRFSVESLWVLTLRYISLTDQRWTRLMLTSGLGASALHRCIVGISLQISRCSLQMKQKFDCGNAGRHFWNSKKVLIYIHKCIICTVWVVGVVSLSSSISRDMSRCLAKFPHSQPSLRHIQKPNDFLHSHTHTDTHTRTHPRSLDTPERERKRVQIMSSALSHLLLAVLSCCNSTWSKAETS